MSPRPGGGAGWRPQFGGVFAENMGGAGWRPQLGGVFAENMGGAGWYGVGTGWGGVGTGWGGDGVGTWVGRRWRFLITRTCWEKKLNV